jgi:hypothetical protein
MLEYSFAWRGPLGRQIEQMGFIMLKGRSLEDRKCCRHFSLI